jgi:predicted MFS family arabinose efflux permease
MRTVVTSGTALIAATYGLARFGYGLFLPQLSDAFAISSTAAGVISAGSFVSYSLAATLAFSMGAHPRRMVVCAGAAAALGSLGVATSPDLLVLSLSVTMAGGGAGFASPGLVALVERNVPAARQENAQTIVNSGTGAGIAVAGILMMVTLGHWRLGWLAISTVVLLATVAVLRADGTAGTPRGSPSPPRASARTGDLTRLARPLVGAAVAGIASAAVWTFGPSIMTSARSSGDGFATFAWMVLGAFGVLGAAAGRIVQTWDLVTAWAITCAAMATATVLLGLAPGSLVLALAAVAAFGASYTALSGVLVVWAVRVAPEHQAEGAIVLFIALAIGQALGSAGLGLLEGVAPQAVTFALAGVVGLLALLPAMTVSTQPSRPTHPLSRGRYGGR